MARPELNPGIQGGMQLQQAVEDDRLPILDGFDPAVREAIAFTLRFASFIVLNEQRERPVIGERD